ncbi:MAG: DinB family protein [Flavobacteriales bacterium]|nr:DinB family protein [Flavobacteriales bacterium]
MPISPANLTLYPAWRRLEGLYQEVCALCEGAGEEACRRPPPEGGWCAAQILDHLVKSEAGTLRYIQKKMGYSPHLPKAGPGAWMRFLLLRTALRAPWPWKAPAMVRAAELHQLPTLLQILAEWQAVRQAWTRFLEHFPPNARGCLVFRHPLAGRLTILQTLTFLADHRKAQEADGGDDVN